jgi:hypothetical protein
MNFPVLVLFLLADEHGKMKNSKGHNSGLGCRIELNFSPMYYVLQYNVSQVRGSHLIFFSFWLRPQGEARAATSYEKN